MLEIGDTTAVRRIITVLRSVGADPIVLVTGHRAEALEAHVADLGVICVRNEQYRTTDMFASVSLGMARICTLCDQFFFTPVDVPLFPRKRPAPCSPAARRCASPSAAAGTATRC